MQQATIAPDHDAARPLAKIEKARPSGNGSVNTIKTRDVTF